MAPLCGTVAPLCGTVTELCGTVVWHYGTTVWHCGTVGWHCGTVEWKLNEVKRGVCMCVYAWVHACVGCSDHPVASLVALCPSPHTENMEYCGFAPHPESLSPEEWVPCESKAYRTLFTHLLARQHTWLSKKTLVPERSST